MPGENKKIITSFAKEAGIENTPKQLNSFSCSEWVSLGHPDKIADYISEYILDRYISVDPDTRYALEVQIKDNYVTLGGEITSKADFSSKDLDGFVRDAVHQIGYTPQYRKLWGKGNTISCEDLIVVSHISKQSTDIAQGVDLDTWGDQGIMFGMAVNAPERNYMPLDIYMARKIGKHLFDIKIAGLDIKTQVVVANDKITDVVVAIPMLDRKHFKYDIANAVMYCCGGDRKINLVINGTGRFVKHASMGDCGTTGRKLAVDFYGGNCNVGGGSPWTKDASKADLTLNLYARHKSIEAIKKYGLEYCKCGISCCIGKREIDVCLYDENNKIIDMYCEAMPPSQIINMFNLRTPIFAKMCREGLFYV